MCAFKSLRDVSNNFENDLRLVSSELFSAKIGHKFDDVIAKKLKDLTLFTSKLKLLKAKPLSCTSQIQERNTENALEEYGDTAVWKVLEQVTAKSLTQAHAVKALITTSDDDLDGELVERKMAIIDNLTQFRHTECKLRHLNALLKEREELHNELRAQWDQNLAALRDTRSLRENNEPHNPSPLYEKLTTLVSKLELMRWLVARLVCVRGPYDWLADPRSRLAALPLTRQQNTVQLFTE